MHEKLGKLLAELVMVTSVVGKHNRSYQVPMKRGIFIFYSDASILLKLGWTLWHGGLTHYL